jgi:alkanesulfonate monooxygenase SsuD/methylene tetrahydromethanopterin reductase-like flavin-dependent oxidoreductase (luciferase family)
LVKGHQLYNRYLDEIERADKLDWDSVIVNEHHQNAYGTMPSPNLMAAALTQRVKRAKIGIVGNALPLHDDPLRVAEEIAAWRKRNMVTRLSQSNSPSACPA